MWGTQVKEKIQKILSRGKLVFYQILTLWARATVLSQNQPKSGFFIVFLLKRWFFATKGEKRLKIRQFFP
tara:strand:- start:5299 stop:5508 length:210 start_codon:yes stop_codon:yes gene_type:complete